MKTILALILVISQLAVFAVDAQYSNAAHNRAIQAAESVGISPLWLYNKTTMDIQYKTAEVQAVLDRHQRMNDELLELCHSMQRNYNRESDVVGCEM